MKDETKRTRSNVDCLDTNAGDRQVGRKAQLSNIAAAKTYVGNLSPLVPSFAVLLLLTDQPLHMQCRGYYSIMLGPQGHVEDAAGSHGWYCVDK